MHALAIFFSHVFGFGFVLYLLPGIIAFGKTQARRRSDSGPELLSGMDRDRLGGCADLGAEAGNANVGEVI